jgi:hypothetical protein
MVEFIESYEQATNEKFIEDIKKILELKKTIINLEDKLQRGVISKLEKYLLLIQEKCREKWSTFDIENCSVGLILIFLSTIVMIICILSFYRQEQLKIYYLSFFKKASVMTSVLYVSSYFIFGSFLNSNYILCILNIVFIIELKPLQHFFSTLKFHSEYLIFFLSLLIPFSNSFIIRENISLKFLIITALCIEFFSKSKHLNKILFLNKIFYLLLLISLLRITQLFYACREEVLISCTENYFVIPLSKISFNSNQTHFDLNIFFNRSILIYLAFIFVNYFLITSIILYILKTNTKFNLNGVKYFFLLQIIILFLYWIVQLFINVSNDSFGLSAINFYSARLFYMIFIVIQIKIWSAKETVQDYLSATTNFVVSLALLATLLSGQSSLSIWILLLVLNIYSKKILALSSGMFLKKLYSSFNN